MSKHWTFTIDRTADNSADIWAMFGSSVPARPTATLPVTPTHLTHRVYLSVVSVNRRNAVGQALTSAAGMHHALMNLPQVDVLSLQGICAGVHRRNRMSRIIKEPFAPRRRHFIMDHLGVRNVSSFYQRLLTSALGADRLAEASLEDLCIVVLLLFLLFTTLLLPWVLL